MPERKVRAEVEKLLDDPDLTDDELRAKLTWLSRAWAKISVAYLQRRIPTGGWLEEKRKLWTRLLELAEQNGDTKFCTPSNPGPQAALIFPLNNQIPIIWRRISPRGVPTTLLRSGAAAILCLERPKEGVCGFPLYKTFIL